MIMATALIDNPKKTILFNEYNLNNDQKNVAMQRATWL